MGPVNGASPGAWTLEDLTMLQTHHSPTRPAPAGAPLLRLRKPSRTRAAIALVAAVTVLCGSASASVAEETTTSTTVVSGESPVATPLSWAPPELTSPITVYPSHTRRDLRLDSTKDYIIAMPDYPVSGIGGMRINGGRNVVLIGGQIDIPASALAGTGSHDRRGLYLNGQTGTIHIEGLRISGEGLGEGINLNERLGATVQLQNVRVDTVTGSSSTNHADVLQTWAGPRRLLVDGLTGHTTYQGFFMLPTQQWTTDPVQPEVFDLRRVDLHGTLSSGYMMWRDKLSWPLKVQDVWVEPDNPLWRDGFLYPKGTGLGTEAWPFVNVGSPAAGEFVPAGTAGLSYRSPGYRAPVEPVEPVEPVVQEPVDGGSQDQPAPEPEPVVSISPVGALDAVVPVDGGLRVTGWAADQDAGGPIAVDLTAAGRTWRVTADGARPDVAALLPEVGSATGFDTVVDLPLGSHEVCVTAVNVATGADVALGCGTATVVDVQAPTFTAGPSLELRTGTVSTAGVVPVTARFAAVDDHGLREVAVTSPFAATYPGTTTAVDATVAAGTHAWTVTARDHAGNEVTASTTRTVALVAEADAVRSKGWTQVRSTALLDGKALVADRAGSSMSHTFTGRGIAWVASKDASSGRAHVYVDGAQVATVDLGAAASSPRQVVFSRGWATSGTHTVKVVVEGTSGRPGVTSDGFITLA